MSSFNFLNVKNAKEALEKNVRNLEVYITLIFILFSIIYYIANFWLVVEKVEVTGENIDHISYNQIKLALQNKIVGTLFTVNINELQKEAAKKAEIKAADVLKIWIQIG